MGEEKVKTWEERRAKAISFLINTWIDSKRREEEYRKRMGSYGVFRRWLYRRAKNLKNVGMVVKEIILKPIAMFLATSSGGISLYVGTRFGSDFIKFVEHYIPPPYGVILYVPSLFCIGFLPPLIIPSILLYYTVKKEVKARLQEYGVEM